MGLSILAKPGPFHTRKARQKVGLLQASLDDDKGSFRFKPTQYKICFFASQLLGTWVYLSHPTVRDLERSTRFRNLESPTRTTTTNPENPGETGDESNEKDSQSPILPLQILVHRIIRRPEPVNVGFVNSRSWEPDGGPGTGGNYAVVGLAVGWEWDKCVDVKREEGKRGKMRRPKPVRDQISLSLQSGTCDEDPGRTQALYEPPSIGSVHPNTRQIQLKCPCDAMIRQVGD
jgi:hypothetical protein